MKKFNLIFLGIIIFCSYTLIAQNGFRAEQRKFSRVRDAYTQKESYLKKLYKDKGIDTISSSIYIRGFKYEKILEVWAKNKKDTVYKHIIDYKFCSSSGQLGPKRQQGDMQTPEGFYYIDRFNPWSSFHLSLGLNYPNQSDKILANGSPGGDIFIHGSCCTIGCIPITDDKINELYILAIEAKNSGQTKIPVHIFPTKFTNDQFEYLKSKYPDDNETILFWENLKEGYDYFETFKRPPTISVNNKGKYIFN